MNASLNDEAWTMLNWCSSIFTSWKDVFVVYSTRHGLEPWLNDHWNFAAMRSEKVGDASSSWTERSEEQRVSGGTKRFFTSLKWLFSLRKGFFKFYAFPLKISDLLGNFHCFWLKCFRNFHFLKFLTALNCQIYHYDTKISVLATASTEWEVMEREESNCDDNWYMIKFESYAVWERVQGPNWVSNCCAR